MAKGFGKKDGIFLGIFSAVLILVCAGFYFLGRQPGAMAEVTADGKFYGAYPLSQDQTVDIMKGEAVTNVLVIQNGMADVIEANCPDKLCVHQKSVSHANETIVCLPNKVVVEIKGGKKRELDAAV